MQQQWYLYSVLPGGTVGRLGVYSTAAAAIADQIARQASFPANVHIVVAGNN